MVKKSHLSVGNGLCAVPLVQPGSWNIRNGTQAVPYGHKPTNSSSASLFSTVCAQEFTGIHSLSQLFHKLFHRRVNSNGWWKYEKIFEISRITKKKSFFSSSFLSISLFFSEPLTPAPPRARPRVTFPRSLVTCPYLSCPDLN